MAGRDLFQEREGLLECHQAIVSTSARKCPGANCARDRVTKYHNAESGDKQSGTGTTLSDSELMQEGLPLSGGG